MLLESTQELVTIWKEYRKEENMSDLKKEYDKILSEIEDRLSIIEEKEKALNAKVSQLQKTISEIENDIYDEEPMGEYDFEIVCPYCNNEFITDLSLMNQEKSEIRCPECNNIIELDWNDDEEEGCGGHCSRMPWMWIR